MYDQGRLSKYSLLIFDKPENFSKYTLISREAALVPNYTVKLLDIDSPNNFKLKIVHRCKAGQAALADENGCNVVTLSPPTCFFDLRERLNALGYNSWAKDIRWIT